VILDENDPHRTHEIVMLKMASMDRPVAPVSLMLVDDHRLFREELRHLLVEEGFDVVGEAANAAEAVSLAEEKRPAVALMDIQMQGGSGIEATRKLAETCPETHVVMLTVSPDERDVIESIQAGASGFLLKGASIEEIAAGVRAAADGESRVSPQIAAELLHQVRKAPPPRALPGEPQLTKRELEVLRLVSDGKGNPEIAVNLQISEQTVKTYVSSLLEKLQVDNRIQAAVYAVRKGLI
jgi:DNA-binding NarL/FixJ family response regulator